MNFLVYLGICVGVGLAIVGIYYAFLIGKGNKIQNQLVSFLSDKDYNAFDLLMNEEKTQKYVRPYNRDVLKLNKAFMRKDKKEIDRIFSHFDEVRLNTKQKEAIYTQAFDYYQALGNHAKVKKYYELIMKDVKDSGIINTIDRMYDIYELHGYRFLNDTLEEIEQAPDGQLPILEGMVASMYKNMGDKEKEKEYFELSKKHFEEFKELMEKED